MKNKKITFILILSFFIIFVTNGCKAVKPIKLNKPNESTAISSDISEGNLRKIVFALVSSAENSTIDYSSQYGYIEDIGDGRGYTAGIIGFTTGTGDLLEVVNKYSELQPNNNLKKYIPALKKVNGTSSHKGLGYSFEADWRAAAKSNCFIEAQNSVLYDQYMKPAIDYALEDNLSPLGQYIYYDALVVHGSGESEDSFEAIRNNALKKQAPPSKNNSSDNSSEEKYLKAFLKERSVVMKKEKAHSDLSRLKAQEKFINEKKFNLELPLSWSMYGDKFSLTENDLKKLS